MSENSVETPSPETGAPEATNGAAADPIAVLQEQLKEKENKYLYLYADFENFKKRAVKERSDLIKFGWENVARELLGVSDNLERALRFIPEGTDQNLVGGLKMVLNQFQATLEKQGVKKIPAIGQNFDPNLHEAVESVASERPAGEIVTEQSAGFTLHGRLLRASRVGVSSGKTTST